MSCGPHISFPEDRVKIELIHKGETQRLEKLSKFPKVDSYQVIESWPKLDLLISDLMT